MPIEQVANHADIELGDVDHFAYVWNAEFNVDIHLLMYVDRLIDEDNKNPEEIFYIRRRILDELTNEKLRRREFDNFVRTSRLSNQTIYLDHYECHAVGAFPCFPFDYAMAVTCEVVVISRL